MKRSEDPVSNTEETLTSPLQCSLKFRRDYFMNIYDEKSVCHKQLGMKMVSNVFLLLVLAISIEARGIDIGLCDDWNVECNCGTQYKILIPVKQCTRFYRWKPSCKPCDKFDQNAMCSKYANCLECSRDQCTRCPPNRYGQWCAGVCTCQNGGTCDGNGNCQCPPGFSGPQCLVVKCGNPDSIANGDFSVPNNEVGSTATYTCRAGFALLPNTNNIRTCTQDGRWSGNVPFCEKSCPLLDLPGSVTSDPDLKIQHWFVRSITFSCPPHKVLSGPKTLNCLPDGQWDNRPPKCVDPCPTPKSPDNGHAFYQGQELVEGAKVSYVCAGDYIIKGHKEATCVNGNWSHPTPQCEKILYCKDPGVPEFAERRVENGLGEAMSVGTKLTFTCTAGSILIGPSEAICLPNVTWSHERPYCIFVADRDITCETKGSDVVEANHAPLRINCPTGCQTANPLVWGTVIYRKDSRICASAIHAGMIPSEGGSVFVVNNGVYNQFVPSNSNGIRTKRHRAAAESYRFNYVDSEEETKCPKGWVEIGNHCVLYVDKATVWKSAASICRNLDSKLVEIKHGNQSDSILSQVQPKLRPNVQARIWGGLMPVPKVIESNETCPDNDTESNCTVDDQPPRVISVSKKVVDMNVTQCGAVDIQLGHLQKEDCQQKFNFLCSIQARVIAEVSVCDDPEPVAHSITEVINQLDNVYHEGVTVQYRCQALYYLTGPSNITCTSNSTWSSAPPTCVKAAACPDPPQVNNGYFDVVPEPRERVRANSKPVPSRRKAATDEQHLANSEKAIMPKNYHRVNTRIQFECESRYYKLVGSSSRTCMANSQWSGRQPSCQPICGTSSAPRAPFVVGGQPTIAGQWPWQVGIARRSYETDEADQFLLVCGAALLTESWVVTAAHCVTHAGTSELVEPGDVKMYFGKYYRNDSRDDVEVQVRDAESIQVHPDFNPVIYDGDIALINLKKPLKLSSRVQPVCLPDPYSGMSERHLKEGTLATVTGWGRDNNSDTDSYPEALMQAEVKIVSSADCELGYQLADVPLSVTGNMFCAGSNTAGVKTDSCSGDSGGPLVVPEGTGVNERWYLEGLVSWGSPRGCGMDKEYGGYTKVAVFLDWIKQYI